MLLDASTAAPSGKSTITTGREAITPRTPPIPRLRCGFSPSCWPGSIEGGPLPSAIPSSRHWPILPPAPRYACATAAAGSRIHGPANRVTSTACAASMRWSTACGLPWHSMAASRSTTSGCCGAASCAMPAASGALLLIHSGVDRISFHFLAKRPVAYASAKGRQT